MPCKSSFSNGHTPACHGRANRLALLARRDCVARTPTYKKGLATLIAIWNSVVALYHTDEEASWALNLDLYITGLLGVEVLSLLWVQRRNFWRSSWNVFDFSVLLISAATLGLGAMVPVQKHPATPEPPREISTTYSTPSALQTTPKPPTRENANHGSAPTPTLATNCHC